MMFFLYISQVKDLLTDSTEPALNLTSITSPSEHISAYNQGNFKASRKKIGPLIQANLGSLSLKSTATADDVSPSEDSGVALLDLSPSAPSTDSPGEVVDPFGALEGSGATTSPLDSDNKDLAPAQPAVDDLLDLDLSPTSVTLSGATKTETSTNEVAKEEAAEEDAIPDSIKPGGLLDKDFTPTQPAVNDLLGLDLSPTLVKLSGATKTETSTDEVDKVEAAEDDAIPDSIKPGGLLDKDLAPAQPAVDDLLDLDLSPTSVTLAGATKTETSTDEIDKEEAAEEDAVPDSIKPGGLLDKDLAPAQPAVDDLLDLDLSPTSVTLAGATKTETSTDEIDKEEAAEEDAIPDSIKPGGLLDLDFFAPKEEDDSEAESVGSLDDYEKDDEPKEVPIRPEQEVLDLISDAIQEENKEQSPSPPGEADKAGSKGADAPSAATESPKDGQAHAPKEPTANPSLDYQLLDPFENHEGVLIEASPLQGTTPEPSATPDTSQPTSPPSASYPGTPPNSYMDLNIMDPHGRGQQDLPSFMNADMVRRIHEKKAALSVMDDQSGRTSRDEHFPFTPQNSVSDSSHDHLTRQPSLPTFDNAGMVEAVENKRSELQGGAAQATSEAMKFPYTPPNSFVDSSMAEMHRRGGPLELIEEDFADRVNKKKQKFAEDELPTSPLDEVDEMDLPTKTTGNVMAFRIAEDMRAEQESKEINQLVNDHSGNVVAYQIAQQMKAREEDGASPSDGPSIWDQNTVRYTGEDEVDVATQLTNDVIQKALEDLGAPGESLQAELAQAEGAAQREGEEDNDEGSPKEDIQTNQAVEAVGKEKPDSKNRPNEQTDRGTEPSKGTDDIKPVEKQTLPQVSTEPPSNISNNAKDTDPPTRPKGAAAGGATVKFTLPLEEVAEAPATKKVLSPDMEVRPHSDSQVSDTSTGGDSDLSQGIADFVSRIRSDTGASVISGNSEDLVDAAVHMDVARQIVDDAMTAAVDIVSQEEEKPAVSYSYTYVFNVLRDWSLITGRGEGYKRGGFYPYEKDWGRKQF